MSTTMRTDTDTDTDTDLDGAEPVEDAVEVRRDGALSIVVGALATVLALAYLVRAVGPGGGLDWLLAVVVGAIAALHLVAVADSLAPLMVLDRHGVRIRHGRTWEGVAWPEVDRVEHRPRTSLLRDGRIEVIDATDRRLGVRLSLSTRLVGADWDELTVALEDLSGDRTRVLERRRPAPSSAPEQARETGDHAEPEPEPEPRPEPVEPVRAPVTGRRTEVLLEAVVAEPPAVLPQATPAEADVTTVLAHVGPVAVADPVVGPVLAHARGRLGLSVEQLAERTRIRPHVIDGIEVDDFAPCGGDFYARGHLRTLARVLGVDVAPLLEQYDEHYADAPIDPRRVFETELATGVGGPIRATRGGMNWSVLVAAVMAVVLVWSVARLVMDHPTPQSQRIVLNGSPSGDRASLTGAVAKVPLEVTAATGGARVIVRDGNSKVVFSDQLPFMGTADVQVVPPVRISSSDGGLVVSLDGTDEGAIGATGQAAQKTYVP